jgi:hypothetical protein
VILVEPLCMLLIAALLVHSTGQILANLKMPEQVRESAKGVLDLSRYFH